MKPLFTTSLPSQQEYFDLFETTNWNQDYKLTPEELILSIQNSSHCISAYIDDKLIGFGRILSDGVAHAVIFDVIVIPKFRKKGIGSIIMKKLLEECKRNKIRDVQLFCASGKLRFYEKFGFIARSENNPGMEIRNRFL